MGFPKLFSSVKYICSRINHPKIVRLFSATVCEYDGTKTEEGKKESTTKTEAEGTRKGLVIGVYESGNKFELTPAAEEINQKSGDKLCRYLNELSCELKLGKAFAITELVPEYGDVALASFGPKDAGYNKLEELDEARENVRWGVGAGVRVLQERGCRALAVDGGGAPDAAAEAAHLAAWRFEEFKACGDRHPATEVQLYSVAGAGAEAGAGAGAGAEAWARGCTLGAAQNWARYLSDMPANKMTPIDFAQTVLDVLCPLGVRVTGRDRDWIQAQRMEAFLAVARGSCEAPVMLECEYRGAGDQPPVLIAANGLTFDSGGLCLKPARGLREGGGAGAAAAAVTVAAIKALAELKVPVNINAVIPVCENMVSGQCMKVGDVVRTLNGLSVLIEDTDLEGRLVLADALVYGQAAYRPALVLDVATLAEGSRQAGGAGGSLCFAGDGAWRALAAAGAHTGDRAIRFPLWAHYRTCLTDDPAVDLKNKGSSTAYPCIGAAFLRNFICNEWVHLDITGVSGAYGQACPSGGPGPGPGSGPGAEPYLCAGRAAGRPARTLATFLMRAANDPAPTDQKS